MKDLTKTNLKEFSSKVDTKNKAKYYKFMNKFVGDISFESIIAL